MHVHEENSSQLMQMHVHLPEKSESSDVHAVVRPVVMADCLRSSLKGHW